MSPVRPKALCRRVQQRLATIIRFEQLEPRQMLAADLSALSIAPLAYYSADGTGVNLSHPTWGSAGVDLLRIAPAQYGDGISTPGGANRPSPRQISNEISDQGSENIISDRLLSAMSHAWGQFIDHDLDLTKAGSTEKLSIAVPTGDPYFDPNSTGTKTIDTMRSAYDPNTGTTTPRQQVNSITAWMDGSMVYGSDADTAAALRTMTDGKLKTSANNMLPLNDAATFPTGTLNMASLDPNQTVFAAGDVRANENIELTSLQTLFVREHNYWATQVKLANPSFSDEQIYQRARSIVIGEIQAITYKQWLPAILGVNALKPYRGYNPQVNPGIANEFATAGFRFGHSMLGDDVEFLDNNGQPTQAGISLAQAFFNPSAVTQSGIDPLLKYLASDPSSEIDPKVVGSIRNFLFGPPGSGGLDLASLNIARGRDHGLADYNSTRKAYGLPKVTSFEQITTDKDVQAKLKQLYGSVDNIDLWVGALAEKHLPGSSVGPTLKAIIADQFTRLRDGDRLWYQNNFSGALLKQIDNTTLTDIIRRNTSLTNLQANVFVFQSGISGTVFNDANKNGARSANERGVPNRTVQLVDSTGAVVATTKTDPQGFYVFSVRDGLRTGEYTVNVLSSDLSKTEASSAKQSITRGDQFLGGVNLAVQATITKPTQPPPPAQPKQQQPPPPKAPSAVNALALNPAAIDQLMKQNSSAKNFRLG